MKSTGGNGGRPAGWGGSARPAPVPIVSDIRPSERGELDLIDVRTSLRSAMWRNVGIERTGAKLGGMIDMIDFWAKYTLDKIFDDPAGWETQNLLLAAALAARSALWREESAGVTTDRTHPSSAMPSRCTIAGDEPRRGPCLNRYGPESDHPCPLRSNHPAEPARDAWPRCPPMSSRGSTAARLKR